MASKRKREVEESISAQNAKQMKMDEVTRSGRVRKKPAKFVEDDSSELDVKDIKPELEALSSVQDLDSQPPAPSAFLGMVGKAVTAPVVTPMPVMPVKQDLELSDEETGKSSNRKSRARKKSAKVLEMEEFEEAEKKQTVKKDGSKKLKSPPAQGMSLAQGGMPVVQAVHNPPIPVLKIKDIPSLPKVEALSLGHVQKSPQKSPMAGTSRSPSAAGKSPDNKGSVIKLLLSSPTQAAGPAVSSTSVSQLTSVPDVKSPPPGKKSKAKGKGSTVANVPAIQTTSPEQKISKMRQALQSNVGVPQMNAGIMVVQQGLGPSEVDDMDDKGMLTIAAPEVLVKEGKRKGGKKAGAVKDESPFLSPPAPSPSVIHVGPVTMGLEVKPETENLMSSSKKSKKGKMKDTSKIDMTAEMMHEDFGLDIPDMELGEPGDDSFMEMDDEDSLMMADDDLEADRKAVGKMGKKKAGKGKSKTQAGESPSSDGVLVMDFARMKQEDSKKKKKSSKEEAAENSSKKKRAPTAYMLFCTETRPKVVNENPKMDFSAISKTLGEMWSTMAEKDKMVWKRKVKKATGKGSTLITTGKVAAQKTVSQTLTARQAAAISQKANPQLAQALLSTSKVKAAPIDDLSTPLKGFGMDPIDVAAHLKILGESLGIIGMKLQEHRGLIAVQGSLSVLLDSMLCALTPLMCLTAVIPETDGLPSETHMKNLDNIAYIMPGL